MGKQPILVSSLIAERLCVGVESVAENDDSGGDNNLLVSVSEFDPYLWSDNVRCFGSTAGRGTIDSCNRLADAMDASESDKIFGPQSRPHDYLTPLILRQGKTLYTADFYPRDVTGILIDNRCSLKITSQPSNRYRRRASWYQIWEGAIIVNAMCIRNGKKGAFKVFSDGAPNISLMELGDCANI